MKRIQGVSASAGLALGMVHRIRHTQAGVGRTVLTPRQETESFAAAASLAKEQLVLLEQRAAEADRDIFAAQRMMLEDDGLTEEIVSYIQAGAGAAAAVERAAGIFAGRIRALEDAYLRERACDVLDACHRVVHVLDGQPRENMRLSEPSVLVAEELYPTDIVTLDRSMVLGFVTAEGSANAHAAIIARTMGIPAVVMAGPALEESRDGQMLALNGDTGEAYLDPDEATKARFAHKIRLMRRHTLTQEKLRALPCVTKDGTRIALLANCASVQDVQAAVEEGAEGVGLLLSEYILLAGKMSTEDEQCHFYAACLAADGERPVTICTYDIGADKTAPGFGADEPNPALGLYGLRYCFAHPEFFEAQLCALLRAGLAGDLRILLPMVTTRADLDRALDAIYHAKTVLRRRGVPFCETVPVGVMIETPAAALMAEELAQKAAFFNIGTTNLAQYAYAVDRANPQVAEYFPTFSPAVHKLVKMAVDAAARAHIPACVCGESASRPELAENYARLGVRSLSMASRSLCEIKEYLMGVTLQ